MVENQTKGKKIVLQILFTVALQKLLLIFCSRLWCGFVFY